MSAAACAADALPGTDRPKRVLADSAQAGMPYQMRGVSDARNDERVNLALTDKVALRPAGSSDGR